MKLLVNRVGLTHRVCIESAEFGRVKAFVTVNEDEAGIPREVFVTCDCPGSLLDGAMDCWAIALSLALQGAGSPEREDAHGDRLGWRRVLEKFVGQQFEPRGWTDNPEIRQASSIVDYVARWVLGEWGIEGASGGSGGLDGASGAGA
jgi:ribonucleoside-diphosphate reductase alpha chain